MSASFRNRIAGRRRFYRNAAEQERLDEEGRDIALAGSERPYRLGVRLQGEQPNELLTAMHVALMHAVLGVVRE